MTGTVRPEYINCVIDVFAKTRTSWCGRSLVMECAFVDIDQAALNGRDNGRYMVCPECRDAIITALRKGYFQ